MQDHGVVPHGAIQYNHDAVPHDAMQKGSDCKKKLDPVYFMLKFLNGYIAWRRMLERHGRMTS
jgi:hypothetical protein